MGQSCTIVVHVSLHSKGSGHFSLFGASVLWKNLSESKVHDDL